MMFILDKNGTYLDYYAPKKEKLGVSPENIIGANIRDTGFSESQIENIQKSIQKALKEQTVQLVEYSLETPAGRGVFEARIAPLGKDKILSIIRDITEREQARKRLHQVNDILRLINKIMQHDILNDLQVVRSALDLHQVGQDKELFNKLAFRLEQSVSLIDRMRELEMLVVEEKALDAFKIRDIIEEVAKGFDVDYTIHGDCTVYADAAFASVIDNIIENAVVHGNTSRIDISIEEKDAKCEIRIADYGSGISEGIKERIFKECFSHGKHAGSGLGLYIVKKIIERYNGTVKIEDNAPSGTIVIINLEKAASK
jgi:PAS domain S-box-containing protein